jgi:ParB-like chromosome segregation protein Spo0J
MEAPQIKMHVSTMVPLGRLNPDPMNPREMPASELDKLMRSIAEFGFVDPVIARREDGLIIGGHQRATALRKLLGAQGLTPIQIENYEIPVIYLDGVTDEKAKLLNVALNKIHGEWDFDKLSTLFASLDGMDPELLKLSGFETGEIDDVLSLMKLDGGDSRIKGGDDEDPDAAIAAKARKFSLEVPTDADAAMVREALAAYGMTSPGNAPAAWLALVRAAHAATRAPGFQAPSAPSKRRSGANVTPAMPVDGKKARAGKGGEPGKAGQAQGQSS